MDKAPSYRKVIEDENRHYNPHFESITHIENTWRNNRIQSDHAVMKRLLGYRQSFRSLRSTKSTLSGIEAIRTFKNKYLDHMKPSVQDEIASVHDVVWFGGRKHIHDEAETASMD
jgi:transposase, IS6 family